MLWVTDLHSANGSVLVSPDGERRPLVPGIRGPAAIGWTVECGNRSFSVRGTPAGSLMNSQSLSAVRHPLLDFGGHIGDQSSGTAYAATESRSPVLFLNAGRVSLLAQAQHEGRRVAGDR